MFNMKGIAFGAALVLSGLTTTAFAGSETTCTLTVTNCDDSLNALFCTFDYNDSVRAFAEEVKSVTPGNSTTISCANDEGKCDTFGNAGINAGDTAVAFCTGIASASKEDYCGDLYLKQQFLGFVMSTSGC